MAVDTAIITMEGE